MTHSNHLAPSSLLHDPSSNLGWTDPFPPSSPSFLPPPGTQARATKGKHLVDAFYCCQKPGQCVQSELCQVVPVGIRGRKRTQGARRVSVDESAKFQAVAGAVLIS